MSLLGILPQQLCRELQRLDQRLRNAASHNTSAADNPGSVTWPHGEWFQCLNWVAAVQLHWALGLLQGFEEGWTEQCYPIQGSAIEANRCTGATSECTAAVAVLDVTLH